MDRRRSKKSVLGSWGGVAVVGVLLVLPARAGAEEFDTYRLVGSFDTPDGVGPIGVLPDGRIVTLFGDELLVESDVASRDFTSLGFLASADISSFGAAFVRVSPDGSKVAVGNNGGASFDHYQIGVVDLESLSVVWFDAEHFDATWWDNARLVITASDFVRPGVVTVLDTTSADPGNPDNVTVIGGIGGASGGIALDAEGDLFTGNGFATTGPSGTGAIKAFAAADWTAAVGGGPVIDFEADGTFIADVLSASPLGFDAEGNLFLGGGDDAPDDDAVAVIRAGAIARVRSGGAPIDAADPADVRRFDPISDSDFNYYSAAYNRVTGELYVRDFADPTVYVYRGGEAVPAVSAWGLAVMALCVMSVGTVALRGGAVCRVADVEASR